MSISRRRLLATGLAAAATVPFGAGAAAATAPFGAGTAAAAPPRLTLPGPTGPYPVGTTALRLLDRSRPDPFTGQAGHRELMVGVWYPARDAGRLPRAPWMEPAVLRKYLVDAGYPADLIATPLTSGRIGAPRARTGKSPVVVFSHGARDHRNGSSVIVQELASRGYVVFAIDHLGDAYSRLPDGRVVTPVEGSFTPAVYEADARFVLDHLFSRPSDRLDLGRIGMFGWSKGGTATARVMLADRRVRAGLAIDAPMLPLMTGVVDRPFMMMTAEYTRALEPAIAQFWDQLRGWRLNVRAAGALHGAYGDLQVLMPQVARITGMSDAELRTWIGDLDPARAVRIDQAYPVAFFDEHLRGRPQRLLDGPSPSFPEVAYLP
ncbi:alpha/beta hydrolase [Actinoplanes bogorensis]|uniref:Alpha/beta hydrolase n=1 Tax=Paractinoplanes bogorensis TaxID=1610840 RepID=A0ABS5Z2J9_9ACTN|nr:alpha/beta hydrolase [Actinoplanes bogorensis]MBU2669920.1 alpha/beta hydrolase [Actinoplanes bogorensis]